MENNPNKTKVLFVITKSNFGGAQKYVYELATELPPDRFEAVVALGGDGLLVSKLRGAGIRTISIPSLMRDVNPLKDFASFIVLYTLFKSESPDIVHLNSAKVSGLGAVAARIAGVPKIIFTAHGWAFNEDRSVLQRGFIKFLSWLTVLFSHKTIAVSDAVKNNSSSWPFIQKKIIVIRNGVKAVNFFSQDEARTRLFRLAGTTIPSNPFVVGTIAELHKNKGLTFAIEAFAKIAKENLNIYYFILGGGEEKENLDALVEKKGLQGRVFLIGFTDDAARYLPAFDIFLLPSITEGLALVLLEAGLAKLPVIASRAGGIPEVIEDGRTGLLVSSRDSELLATAVKGLIDSPALCTTLGNALYKKTTGEFSITRVVSETAGVYSGK